MRRCLSHFAAATGGVLSGSDADYTGVSIDSRKLAAGELFVALSGPNFDGHAFVAAAAERGAVGAVVARPVDVALPQVVVGDTERALQQAAMAHRDTFEGPVVAVAGSNGKTTTKELVRAILAQRGPVHATRGNLNNHLGVPLTLLQIESTHRAAVVELGANHAGEVAVLTRFAAPTVGIVTNAGAEHLEGFGSLEGVARAEGELFAGLAHGAAAVLNADDEFAPLWRTLVRAGRTLSFGAAPTADVRITGWVADAGGAQQFTLVTPAGSVAIRMPLLGRHNAQNAAGAAAAALAAGATLDDIAAGLAGVQPVSGRLVPRAGIAGARLIDDTYNANPSSVTAGLQLLAATPGERWVVLGEMAELGAHTDAAHVAAGQEARAAGATRLFTLGGPTRLAAASFGAGAESFDDWSALAAALGAALRGQPAGAAPTVYFKGSRVNRLERVVDAVLAPAGKGETHAA